MYLFDADSLILANRHDFPLDTDPGTFWQFLEEMGNRGEIRIPEAVFGEIERKDDRLKEWLTVRRNVFLIPNNDAHPFLTRVLVTYGFRTDLELEQFAGSADPYIIAHALCIEATVVTNEMRQPGITNPAKKKIPDICDSLRIPSIHYPRFLWEMSP
ncbi:MAG: DUF4411 family protein [Dehalococcoidia bacterium]|nr:DUF4411 family protein [Dehalococcoidia bacterium]